MMAPPRVQQQQYFPPPLPTQRQAPRPQLARQPQPTRPAPLTMPAPSPVARAQSDDEERRPLAMPSPEALGVSLAPREQPGEWTKLLEQLESLGITSFQFDGQDGGFRFACVVPTANGPVRLETMGATKSEALRQALTRVGR